jgi:Holliday junction resolvase RusA-like endonuclease
MLSQPPAGEDLIIAFVAPLRPPSLKRSNVKFQESLRTRAFPSLTGVSPLEGRLYARITWFHRGATSQDVDNIAKNILDALKGVCYLDDSQITTCFIRKARIDLEMVELRLPDPVSSVVSELLRLLNDDSVRDVLYLELGPIEDETVYFGQAR